ncbi:NAD-dependent epimerase/dehydratase family protein [uncultured Devosia sp.]|uniref:NAD-dependent epimerase/dehydratase family protein n=1 Tax=uncultured Devosia sp. TaxID=211434 RepID=UPI0035CC8FB5
MKLFITGTAGFIGFHLALRLLRDGHEVIGYDGVTPYYDVRLKRARLHRLAEFPGFHMVEAMLEDKPRLLNAISEACADIVVHLGAQAGVRYSIDHPESYISSNLVGTANLLEGLRAHPPRHFMFASTSSVYGGNEKMPFAEVDRADGPVSLYAATKKGGEAMTHSYAHLWNIPTTCFRFFTVYGPWGRPDMALFKFVDAIERGAPIDIYGEGKMRRDFTYVDDLVAAIVRLIDQPPVRGQRIDATDSLSAVAPWRTVNIAGGKPVGLLDFVDIVEKSLGKPARKTLLPMQQGDVAQTMADPTLLRAIIGFVPETNLEDGVAAFVDWYRRDYVGIVGGQDAVAV